MSDHDTTTTTSDHDPIRPAHYRDDTGRDLFDDMRREMSNDEYRGACAAIPARYMRRAGKKPGVPAAEDMDKARMSLRRAIEANHDAGNPDIWLIEHLSYLMGKLGIELDGLRAAAEQPRDTTPQDDAPAVTTVGEWCAEEWARDAALALLPQGWTMRPGKHGYPEFVGKRDDRPAAIVWRGGNTSWRWAFEGQQDRSREVSCAIEGIREADAVLRAVPAEVTPQQAAAIPPDRPFPADVHFNVDRYGPEWLWSVQIIERRTIAEGSETTEDEARSKAKAAHMAYEAQQAAGARPLRQRPAPQANPLAGVTPLPPGRYWEPRDGVEAEIGPVIVINGKGGGVMVRIGTLAGILAYVEKHAPGMLPHGWPAAQDDHAGVALRLTPNELHALAWLVVRAGGFTDDERRAEHAIISAAQRCGWPNEAQPPSAQDTARDDGSDSSASGEGDSALPPDGYDWHDGAGDTEVLTDEHEEAAAWITRSTLPGGADQWSWWLASDSAIGVEKDVRHESTWKAARIGVRRAIERRRSDSSAQRSAEGGEA